MALFQKLIFIKRWKLKSGQVRPPRNRLSFLHTIRPTISSFTFMTISRSRTRTISKNQAHQIFYRCLSGLKTAVCKTSSVTSENSNRKTCCLSDAQSRVRTVKTVDLRKSHPNVKSLKQCSKARICRFLSILSPKSSINSLTRFQKDLRLAATIGSRNNMPQS